MMEKLYIEDIADLAKFMVDEASEGHHAIATLFFDRAKELVKELICCNADIGYIELCDYDFNNYEREYYVSLSNDMMLFVEKAWNEEEQLYLQTMPDLMLLDGDASYGIVVANPDADFIELDFVDEVEIEIEEDIEIETDIEFECDAEDEICCKKCCCSCSVCEDSEEDDSIAIDAFGELLYDKHGKPVGAKITISDLFDYLFYI